MDHATSVSAVKSRLTLKDLTGGRAEATLRARSFFRRSRFTEIPNAAFVTGQLTA